MNSPVIVSKGKNPYQVTRMALQQTPFPSLKGRRVLIKPNAGRVASPGQGVTTHPSVVEAGDRHGPLVIVELQAVVRDSADSADPWHRDRDNGIDG